MDGALNISRNMPSGDFQVEEEVGFVAPVYYSHIGQGFEFVRVVGN
jgi:hypothetical protein